MTEAGICDVAPQALVLVDRSPNVQAAFVIVDSQAEQRPDWSPTPVRMRAIAKPPAPVRRTDPTVRA